MSGRTAEKMFWKLPELVDKLISFLDVESVSKLAEVHQLTAQVLQSKSAWDKLVKRSCPYYEHTKLSVTVGSWGDSHRYWVMKKISALGTTISHFSRILRRMTNPKAHLLKLLHMICNRFSPVIFRPWLFT